MKTFFIAFTVAVLAAYGTVKMMPVGSTTVVSETKKESVYDRVMRTGVVRAGYFPWPTYFDVNPNTKEITGSSKELCDAVFKMLGLKVEYVEISANIVQDLENGKIDTRCADSPWALQTVKYIDYTSAFYNIPNYIFARADEERFANYTDLNNQKVRFVGLDGDVSTELVQLNFPQATILTHPISVDTSQLLLNITTNKADVFIVDPAMVAIFNANNKDQLKPLFGDKIFALSPVSFSVKKGEDKWFQTLDYAVKMAHHIGLVDAILNRYDPDNKKFVRVQY
jgi:polar amino acid transport system substrate-binding protein